jgi:Cell division protein CrgA
MPESRIRRKSVFTPPAEKSGALKPNPRWFAPLMVGLMLIGLAWIVVYYLTQAKYPVPDITHWNLIAGFGILLTGFAMMTRWR